MYRQHLFLVDGEAVADTRPALRCVPRVRMGKSVKVKVTITSIKSSQNPVVLQHQLKMLASWQNMLTLRGYSLKTVKCRDSSPRSERQCVIRIRALCKNRETTSAAGFQQFPAMNSIELCSAECIRYRWQHFYYMLYTW